MEIKLRTGLFLTLVTAAGLGFALLLPWLANTQGLAAVQEAPESGYSAPLAGPCYATPDDGATVFDSADNSAVQDAVDAAAPGAVVKLAGTCVGVLPRAGLNQTVYISKSLTLQGGHTHTDWSLDPDPETQTTTLDAGSAGRVAVISGTTDVTLDGLYITGGATSDGELGNRGGGIWTNSSMTLTNSIIHSNTALVAGGMYNLNVSPAVSNVTFSENSANSGGAIYDYASEDRESSPTLTNVTFSGNSANNNGGAIYNYAYRGVSNPTLSNVSFSGNSAGVRGGAIYNLIEVFDGEGNLILTNVTFSGNSAGDEGGAMYNIGGFNGKSNTEVYNSILWDNQANGITGTITATIFNANATITLNHSLVEGSGGSGVDWIGGIYQDGGGNIDQNPLFIDPISPSSTPTTSGDLRLGAGSPAIDAGDNIYTQDTGVGTDLDGGARFKDGDGDGDVVVDMGAYEAKGYYQLNLAKSGAGGGKITGSPAGIDCGNTCKDYLMEGTDITLKALPDEGSTFSGWNGACSGDGDCQVTINGDRSVTANFDLELIEPAFEISLPLVSR